MQNYRVKLLAKDFSIFCLSKVMLIEVRKVSWGRMLTLSGPEFACGKDRVLRGPLLLLLLTAPPCELSAISNARPGQPTIMELQARRFAFPLLFQGSLAFNWIAMMNLPRPTSLLSSTGLDNIPSGIYTNFYSTDSLSFLSLHWYTELS